MKINEKEAGIGTFFNKQGKLEHVSKVKTGFMLSIFGHIFLKPHSHPNGLNWGHQYSRTLTPVSNMQSDAPTGSNQAQEKVLVTYLQILKILSSNFQCARRASSGPTVAPAAGSASAFTNRFETCWPRSSLPPSSSDT